MIKVSYRDKIVRLSCHFAKVCDCEVNKKRSLYFRCFIAYMNKCCKVCVRKAKILFQDVMGCFLKILGRQGKFFDKS